LIGSNKYSHIAQRLSDRIDGYQIAERCFHVLLQSEAFFVAIAPMMPPGQNSIACRRPETPRKKGLKISHAAMQKAKVRTCSSRMRLTQSNSEAGDAEEAYQCQAMRMRPNCVRDYVDVVGSDSRCGRWVAIGAMEMERSWSEP
jgi:hypothetical protein